MSLNRRVLSFALTFVSVTATSSIWADPVIPDAVKEHVKERIENEHCPAIAIGMIDPSGRATFFYGNTAMTDGRPVDAGTLFEIGSITKAFTGILLADCVARGEVKYDDPIQKYLPDGVTAPTRGDKQITLLDLATHHSGLPRLPDNLNPSDDEDPYADYTDKLLYEFLTGHELSRDIGSEYEYSNLGAGLLGHLLARATGKTYELLLVERISKPLGMGDTAIHLSDDQQHRLAHGHAGVVPVPNWTLDDALAAAGAIRSTTTDMLTFLAANAGIESSPIAGAMNASHERRQDAGRDMAVGLGWHIDTGGEAPVIWHNGGTGGYHSYCGFRPDTKLGVVVLTNSTENIDDIGRHLLDPSRGLSEIKKTVNVPSELLDAYVGWYELQPGLTFHITREGDQLMSKVSGQGAFPIYPESATKFYYKVVNAQVTFVRDEAGKVTSMILHQNGDHTARRLPDDYAPPPPPKEIMLDKEILERYVGKYQLAPGAVLAVAMKGDQLTVQLTGQPAFPIFAESETKFFLKVVEAKLTFDVDDSGKPTAVTLHQSGMDQRATRME